MDTSQTVLHYLCGTEKADKPVSVYPKQFEPPFYPSFLSIR
jgi:hypothetical protein